MCLIEDERVPAITIYVGYAVCGKCHDALEKEEPRGE
jgi:hypothetical protein